MQSLRYVYIFPILTLREVLEHAALLAGVVSIFLFVKGKSKMPAIHKRILNEKAFTPIIRSKSGCNHNACCDVTVQPVVTNNRPIVNSKVKNITKPNNAKPKINLVFCLLLVKPCSEYF